MLLVDAARMGDLEIPLWTGTPPGGEGVTIRDHVLDRTTPNGLPDRVADSIATPVLIVFKPEKPDGTALLIAPGGGYARVVIDKEGFEAARLFNRMGTTVYVLRYRLPAQGWANPAVTPLQDAQRAMRLIRQRAGQDGVDPSRVMAMGFSAGGHVAGSLTLRWDAPVYPPRDEADALSARPDYSVLVYPVATLAPPFAHAGSRENLLGAEASPERIAAFSLENLARKDGPPVFLLHAGDDAAVPVENSLQLYAALKAAGQTAALHVFTKGGHGFGLRGAVDSPLQAWPQLVDSWAGELGWRPRAETSK